MFTSQTIPLPNVSIHAAIGPPAGPPLLLLHGVGRNWRDFRPLLPWLVTGWQVIGWDHRGHGRSGRTPGRYAVADYAQDVLHWLAEQPPAEPIVIYGHSLGALTALAVAAGAPDKVRGLVLEEPPTPRFLSQLDSSPYRAVFTAMQQLAGNRDDVGQVARRFADTRLPVGDTTLRLGDLRDATSLRFSARALQHVDPQVFAPLLAGRWLEGYAFDELLAAVRCPVLLLGGSLALGGMMYDGEAEEIAGRLQDATLIKPQGAGHLIHWQFIEQTARLVLGFVDSLE